MKVVLEDYSYQSITLHFIRLGFSSKLSQLDTLSPTLKGSKWRSCCLFLRPLAFFHVIDQITNIDLEMFGKVLNKGLFCSGKTLRRLFDTIIIVLTLTRLHYRSYIDSSKILFFSQVIGALSSIKK